MTGHPPRFWRAVLACSLAATERDAIMGDLEEEFSSRARADLEGARAWYRGQVVTSVAPNLLRRFRAARHTNVAPATLRRRPMTGWLQDVRFSARWLMRRPVSTLAITLSLALGIAMSAGVYSLVEAVLLRPVAVRHPEALRLIVEARPTGPNGNFSHPGFVALRRAQRSFDEVAAYATVRAALRTESQTEMVDGEVVSGSYFTTLQPELLAGRGLTDADLTESAQAAVVLSAAEWRRLFGDAALSNQVVALNGRAFTVVGIVAHPFRGMTVGTDVRFWAPVSAQPLLADAGGRSFLAEPRVSWLTLVGRLNTNATDVLAEAELNSLRPLLIAPPPPGAAPTTSRLTLAPGVRGDSRLSQSAATPLGLLLGTSLLLLFVACGNAAGLQLARAQERRRELAVRTALGAGAARVVRLVVIESACLSACGLLLGLAGAAWIGTLGLTVFSALGQPMVLEVGVNLRVLLFGVAAGGLATIVAAAAPALYALRGPRSAEALAGGRSVFGSSTHLGRRLLIVGQFALTLAMVATAALLVRTVLNLRAVPTGLDVEHVSLFAVAPTAAGYRGSEISTYYDRALARLAGMPAVAAAAYGRVIPLGFGGSRGSIEVAGEMPAATPDPGDDAEVNFNIVSADYFNALGIPLLAGRPFASSDGTGAPLVAVVNETMARRYWRESGPIGREFRLASQPRTITVVGVVSDVKYRTLREASQPSFYLPLAQAARLGDGVLHVRTVGDPTPHLGSIRRALSEADAAVPIRFARTLRQQLSQAAGAEQVSMALGVTMGVAALALSALGLFAAMSTSVSQRRRELGVRLAMGATPSRVARLVTREALALTAIGASAGAGLAWLLGRAIQGRLFDVSPLDPISLAASTAVLAMVALTSSWMPARRAARVNPVEVLRDE